MAMGVGERRILAFGARAREWRLARQGLVAWLVCTVLIVLAGALVAAFSEPPLRYDEFTLKSGVLIAVAIGVAAALASADDAGRRELIGLAATAHITILPAWLGIALVFGMPDAAMLRERALGFAVSVAALIVAALVTFAVVGGSARGLRRYAGGEGSSRKAPPES